MEPVGDCSVLARLCHQCSVTEHTHTHHLWRYNCEIFSHSLISLLCLYLRFGPRFQIASQARFCEVSSVLSPASPCWRIEQGGAQPAALQLPILFPLPPYIMSLLMVSFMDSSCLRLEPTKPSSALWGTGLRGGQVAGVPPTGLTSSSQLTVSVFTPPVTVLLIYQKVWKFGMLFQFALFIYDDFVIVFYTFGFINYVNVKMSISKKSVKLWPKKTIRCIFKKESPGFMNHRYKLEIL